MQRFITGLAVVVLVASIIVLVTVKPAASEQPRPHAQPHQKAHTDHVAADRPMAAVCVLSSGKDGKVAGVIHLHESGDGVRVTGTVTGLTPNSTHAIHIHEFGDISAPDGMSAGSHYNPEGHDHGLPGEAEHRHAGDMGNLKADGDGTAAIDQTFDNFTLAGENPVLGRAIVVHEKEDDGGQPVGNAGGRIAFGVIGIASPRD